MGNFMSKIKQRRVEILLFKNCEFWDFSVRFQFVLDCVWFVFLTAEVKGKFKSQISDCLFSR